MDIQFIADDPIVDFYKARVWTNSSLLLQIPSWSYSLLHNREEINATVHQNVTDAMDDCRHAFATNKASQEWKYLILDFPKDHQLSSKEINEEAGEEEELELEIIPINYTHPQIQGAGSQHWACWKVVQTDVKVHKRGKIVVKGAKSRAASILGASFISPGTKTEWWYVSFLLYIL